MFTTITKNYKNSSLVMKLTTLLFGVTFIHHLWGEVVYGGGVRAEIAIVFAIVFALTVGLYALSKKHAWVKYLYWILIVAFWVVLVGLIEGGYNHVFKVGAWLAGVSPETLADFYGDEYEPVSDFFFEATGVLTAVVSLLIIKAMFKKSVKSTSKSLK